MSKKKIVQKKSSKLPVAIIAVIAVVALAAIFLFNGPGSSGKEATSTKGGSQTSAPATSETPGADLVIPKSEISEVVKFYPYKVDNIQMEVLAVKAKDGTIRTSFNTCQVCYSSGRGYYVQKGDTIVCQNCGNVFNIDQVEKVQGGCNPVPITGKDKKDDGTNITISKTVMVVNKNLFLKWKK